MKAPDGAAAGRLSVRDEERVPPPASPSAAVEAIDGETPIPLAEKVARRVYELLCQDLRRDRERRGRWW